MVDSGTVLAQRLEEAHLVDVLQGPSTLRSTSCRFSALKHFICYSTSHRSLTSSAKNVSFAAKNSLFFPGPSLLPLCLPPPPTYLKYRDINNYCSHIIQDMSPILKRIVWTTDYNMLASTLSYHVNAWQCSFALPCKVRESSGLKIRTVKFAIPT